MTRIHVATGLLVREDRVLLVASRYPNQAQPLWNLPGGRQQPGELLRETVAREFREEVALEVRVGELCYVSESYDGDAHVLNVTFRVESAGTPRIPQRGDHVADAGFVPLDRLASQVTVRVVREPLLAYLRDSHQRYAGYTEAGISIVFPD